MNRWISIHTFAFRLHARAREERGQALVEFAVILPVLLLLIIGILYFGRYMDYTNQETQLAAEGARWAAVNYSPSGTLQSYIQSQAQPELQAGSSDVGAAKVYIYDPSNSSNPTPPTLGNPLRVCVVSTFKYPTLLIGGITQTVAESATMRVEVAGTWSPSNNPTVTVPPQCPTS